MKTQTKIKLSSLHLNDGSHGLPKNPRFIRDARFKKLCDSIRDFPDAMKARGIVVDESGVILGGNMRWRACRELGMTEIPAAWVHRLPGLTVEQKRRFVIMDNRGFGEDDMDLLANEWDIDELIDAGFDEEELTGLVDEAEPEDAEAQTDKAEELNKVWKVKAGDLWQIGEHRLTCGDCTDKAVVERAMGGEKVGGIIADPPYGMRLNADFSGMKNSLGMFKSKGLTRGNKYADVIGDHEDFDAAPVIATVGDPAIQFWFGADYYASTLPDAQHSGAWLVWDKRLDESADKMFGSCFELIWARQKCKRDIIRIKWAGVFGTEKEQQRGRVHPNQKPVALLVNLVERTEGIILDPFLGSGTTMVACQNLNRKCHGIEISPAYCAVILQRMTDAFPGIKIERVK